MQTRRGIWNLENVDTKSLVDKRIFEGAFIWAPLRIIGATGSLGNPIGCTEPGSALKGSRTAATRQRVAGMIPSVDGRAARARQHLFGSSRAWWTPRCVARGYPFKPGLFRRFARPPPALVAALLVDNIRRALVRRALMWGIVGYFD